jgi:hypothetical protein
MKEPPWPVMWPSERLFVAVFSSDQLNSQFSILPIHKLILLLKILVLRRKVVNINGSLRKVVSIDNHIWIVSFVQISNVYTQIVMKKDRTVIPAPTHKMQ